MEGWTQRVEFVEHRDKDDFLLRFLKSEEILEGLILIFVETKRGAGTLKLAWKLCCFSPHYLISLWPFDPSNFSFF